MKHNRSERGFTVGEACLVKGGLYVFLCIISGFCWQYSINHWLAFAHKPVVFPFWGAFLMGFVPVFGQLAVPVALLTWIVSFFM